MSLALRSSKLLRLVCLTGAGTLALITLLLSVRGSVWTQYDYKILDLFYRAAVSSGRGPAQSPRIVITTFTDNTYNYFRKNFLDRKDLANVNDALAQLGVDALAYDVIFARASNEESDARFAESIRSLGTVYLPIGFAIAEQAKPFRWEEGAAYERFRSDFLRRPVERGEPRPYHATRALMQYDRFSEEAFNSGHISAYSDPDGVYRHVLMLLKVDEAYVPTLTLSMFLDHVRVPFEKMVVEWGERIVIPALKESFLEKDVVIPIDRSGRTFIPYPAAWDLAFKKMEADALLRYLQDENLRGNLLDFYEGKFVLIGDISVGTADLGHTPLEADAPLVLLHAAMLNGLLTNTFYSKWSLPQTILFLWIAGIVLAFSAALKSSWFLYGTGVAAGFGIAGFTWMEISGLHLFPAATVGGGVLIVFLALVTSLELAVGRERSFIRKAFSRYVPGTVVDTLISRPDLLKLGGEERVMTVLFSDLAGFTSISEHMSPAQLVRLLNEYLTEMTTIVLAEGGIIDKFEGDAIMAEFGAPLPLTDHAERAVRTGLKMQRRLAELRRGWANRGLPELKCRVGINTGSMIVGNMGSDQVFDYTVIGDSVNLASRLEGANKRYDTYLMISESTFNCLVPGLFRTRVLDVIKVKGKSRAVKVFEVVGESSTRLSPEEERYLRAYEEGFEAYLSRDFPSARTRFREALSMRPDDPASRDMLERMETLDPGKLPPDWDGSIALTSK
jgi:adenylate cyclase